MNKFIVLMDANLLRKPEYIVSKSKQKANKQTWSCIKGSQLCEHLCGARYKIVLRIQYLHCTVLVALLQAVSGLSSHCWLECPSQLMAFAGAQILHSGLLAAMIRRCFTCLLLCPNVNATVDVCCNSSLCSDGLSEKL